MINMVYCDANIVLRYLLQDNDKHFQTARTIIHSKDLFILNEVVAEIVYVLLKVYSVKKADVCTVLKDLFIRENMHFNSKDVILSALDLFSSTTLDFVDCILCAYGIHENASIASFDVKIARQIQKAKNSVKKESRKKR